MDYGMTPNYLRTLERAWGRNLEPRRVEMDEAREALEQEVRRACEAGEHERGASLAIEHYGPELIGFLTAQLGARVDAEEAFAQLSEDLWKSLERFEWRCSLRTWAYKLARRAAGQQRRRERKHAHQGLSQASRLSQAVERVRTRTEAWRRTEVKDRFQALREQLPEEDRAVLILRVDRGLSWLELAEVMHAQGDDLATALDGDALKREAARLRKRFQLAKERLKQLAQEEGLLEG